MTTKTRKKNQRKKYKIYRGGKKKYIFYRSRKKSDDHNDDEEEWIVSWMYNYFFSFFVKKGVSPQNASHLAATATEIAKTNPAISENIIANTLLVNQPAATLIHQEDDNKKPPIPVVASRTSSHAKLINQNKKTSSPAVASRTSSHAKLINQNKKTPSPAVASNHNINRTSSHHSKKDLQLSSRSSSKKTMKQPEIIDFKKRIQDFNVLFLKTICSDSHVCFGFGIQRQVIKKFFDNFTNFSLLVNNIDRIRSLSDNAAIRLLQYEKETYKANAILKIPKGVFSIQNDNLLYEACVGFFLNNVGKFLPCFLETYGLFYLTNKQFYEKMTDMFNNIPSNAIIGNISPIFVDPSFTSLPIDVICPRRDSHLCLLVEHLKEVKDMYDYFIDDDFRIYEFLQVLFQIYFPLVALDEHFTHYDLHGGNVLLYQPVKNSFIEYKYYDTKTGKLLASFYSTYIVKIIDYGSCFFKDSNNTWSSQKVYELFKTNTECNNYEAKKDIYKSEIPYASYGYGNENFRRVRFFNGSHDLLLIQRLKVMSKDEKKNKKFPLTEDITTIFEKLDYFDSSRLGKFNTIQYSFGTPPNTRRGYPDTINNCIDLLLFLINMINKESFQMQNKEFFKEKNKLGTLHIYDKKPLIFEKFIKE